MKKVWIWSLGIGVALALFVVALLATGPGHHDLLYNADIVLVVVGVVFMHRAMKREGDGSLTYLKALGTGVMVSGVAGVLSRLAYYLYLEFVDDSLFSMIADQWHKALTAQGLEPAAIEERLSGLDFDAWNFASANLVAFVVPAVVLVAIAAIFTRGRRQLPQAGTA